MLRNFLYFIALALMLGLSACATPPRNAAPTPSVAIKAGRSVAVLQGETLYSYARRNNASMREIIDLNRLQAPYVLAGGQVLKLPVSDADLPSVELGPVARVNETEYKQKHRGKPVTTYTQVAPELITEQRAQALAENREGPVPSIKKSELQTEANNQFNPQAMPSSNGHEVISATSALNLKPLQFDAARKHLVEDTKASPVTLIDKDIIKSSPQAKVMANKNTKNAKPAKGTKPDPNDIDIPAQITADKKAVVSATPSKLPSEFKKPDPKVAVKESALPEVPVEPEKPMREMHSRIEKGAEPKNLVWPVQGTVISTYGPKSNGLKNDGVNIAVPRGTPVLAADGGTVAYAGSDIPGYGNVVLVRHPNGLMTTYAHLERTFVQENIVVAKGDLLGTVGTSGGVDTPQLHFEIRRDKEALDPGKYLYR